ncbi:restriction modification system DNA specificity domain protein [Desulfobulbus propionicus DSM 2032]|uniref:Restriction modification system DNA specificity domain protein n=1 Tax=Desulfobulbus propionicus (strain ATCC 33891 / DSM 2032 / VKM B-1956 / 1pr3) TaxID=577650 RepID=A0A7U4DNE2_DESPD|nr:restriction endonuclease subunit S [Desulfobulbus propionicus]ADW16827.1 restriction modification system DNA specificity domain protein [Desulfobulbus propionicus DSM 2032]
MKLETFFEKFELFADAPDAVARMREVVLELAVRGKLVNQVPVDESAHLLLERIKKTKERLVADRRIKRQAILPVNEEELPFLIPEHWAWTRLGEIGDWGSGSTPSRGNPELYDGGITWLKSGELNDNQSLAGSEETVSELALNTCSFRRNEPGDILLAMYGATIGKVAILAESAVTNQAVCGCTVFDGVLNRYLFIFLLSQRSRFHSASEGGAQPNISKVKIVGFPFPLPPLAEQKRIVAKVDELMALCDQLEAQQQERQAQHAVLVKASLARFTQAPTPDNLQFLFHPSYTVSPADLRKTILTLAVQGKLVPQESEPLLGSLESILAEASVNGVSKGPTADPSAVEVLRISAGTSREDFYVNEEDFKHVDLPANEVKKFQLAPGDLLACRFNGNLHFVGRFSLYRGESRRIQVNPDKLIRFRINTDLHSPRYVCYAMNAAPTREAIEAMCATTAGNIGLSAGRLKTVEIPLPPLAEQRRIVAKVDELMALVDDLETQLAASRTVAHNLLAALVRELTTNP